ncbi:MULTISPECIES: hypothetical protein [Oxalobacteraceae]|uniref:hypothetical protein n=1 Tax=Oxalobacteraceae TaxID=75682 RepID=UPI0018F70D49|nr:hypothetical protein [Noviherbaspirillum saxi]
MTKLDWATFIAGVVGLLLLSVGAGMVYFPAGLITLGAGLLGWSYAVARAGRKG